MTDHVRVNTDEEVRLRPDEIIVVVAESGDYNKVFHLWVYPPQGFEILFAGSIDLRDEMKSQELLTDMVVPDERIWLMKRSPRFSNEFIVLREIPLESLLHQYFSEARPPPDLQ